MARLLKAKYFLNSDFLNVVPSSNISFVWRGILATIPLLCSRMYWRIGSGQAISIWLDAWLPSVEGVGLHQPLIPEEVVLWSPI